MLFKDITQPIEKRIQLLIAELTTEEPLYPFGYGLSYSKFKYERLDIRAFHKDGKLKISVIVSVKNISEVDGAEVVQLYVAKKDSKYNRPAKKLCAFERVEIPAGKTVEVNMEIDPHYLEVFEKGEFVLEEGKYEFTVGRNSKDDLLSLQINL